MSNELILLLTVIVDFLFVLAACRLGKSWLYATIVVNLILISALGTKLVTVAGFVTNSGNAYYAAVFLALQMLTEHHGRKAAFRAVGIGVLASSVSLLLAKLIVIMTPAPESLGINEAMITIFRLTPRVALASITAFAAAGSLNIWFYQFVRERTNGMDIGLRSMSATMIGQFVDSAIFFTIAFAGVVLSESLFEAFLIGFVLKVLAGIVALPFLYISRPEPRA